MYSNEVDYFEHVNTLKYKSLLIIEVISMWKYFTFAGETEPWSYFRNEWLL